MKRNPDDMGRLVTKIPTYDKGTKVFAQSMEFRSDVLKLDGEAIGHVTARAAELFKGALVMNELDDFAWPPDEVSVVPHADFKGAAIRFATRATKRAPIILQS